MLAVALLTLAYAVPGHGTFFAITGFATLPLLFISNAFVPFDAMPGWMAAIARVNPLSYAIASMRILLVEGWTAELPVALGVLAASAVVLLACGTWEFRRHTGGRVV
jgi:ABC-2 type transport system permease protein